jgi:hypothetical protein
MRKFCNVSGSRGQTKDSYVMYIRSHSELFLNHVQKQFLKVFDEDVANDRRQSASHRPPENRWFSDLPRTAWRLRLARLAFTPLCGRYTSLFVMASICDDVDL